MTDQLDTVAIRRHNLSNLSDDGLLIEALCGALIEGGERELALRTENERLRAALRPFAAAADDYCDPAYDDDYSPLWAEFFVFRDFRRARAALAACNVV